VLYKDGKELYKSHFLVKDMDLYWNWISV
jgi:hypothetical protein